MNLGKIIDSLLKRYTEVYVPGIGVFRRKHSPAQFDKQNNVFLPPISYVELDQSSQKGFNLVYFVQQQENLPLEEAKAQLDGEVRRIKSELVQAGEAKLEQLGHLVSYGVGVVFKPLDLSGFDFKPVPNIAAPHIETVIPELEQEVETGVVDPIAEDVSSEATGERPKEEESELPVDVPVVETSAGEAPVSAPLAAPVNVSEEATRQTVASLETDAAEEEAIADEEDEVPKSPWFYWLLGAIVVGGIITAFLWDSGIKKKLFGDEQPIMPDTVVTRIATPAPDTLHIAAPTADTAVAGVDSNAVTPPDTLPKHDNISAEQAGEVLPPAPAATPRYQLVVGSAKTMAQARQEAARYRSLGHKTVRAVEGKYKKNLKRVIYGTYLTKEEAQRAKVKVSADRNFKDPWVEKL